jgi:hypothetical protein
MFELSIRTSSVACSVRLGRKDGDGKGVTRVIDWDAVASEKKLWIDGIAQRQQAAERRLTEFLTAVPAFSRDLLARFVTEAERFNDRQATPGTRIEIAVGDRVAELKKYSTPYGVLKVSVHVNDDATGQIECEASGSNAETGAAETEEFQYPFQLSPLGFVIRKGKKGPEIAPGALVDEAMKPFAFFIS